MDLSYGDKVSGESISAGKYLGKDEIDSHEFHKIYDSRKKITLYVPLGKEGFLRKLPTANSILKDIKMFKFNNFVDYQEIDGSRYKYFKAKLAQVNFKAMLEVFHDLKVLHQRKRLSPTERKLLYTLKEKLVTEISIVLNCEQENIENMLILNENCA